MAHDTVTMSHVGREALPPFLTLRSVPPAPPQARSAILWGEASVGRLAVRTAAAAVDGGISVAVIDGAMAFDITTITAYAQARRLPPERFLQQIYIARAFTCHQLATLICERLDPLLASRHIGLVVILGPCTTFFDESMRFKEVFFLFQQALHKLAELRQHGPLLLLAQGLDAYPTRRIAFVRELVRIVELGIRVHTVAGRRQVQLVKPRQAGTSPPVPTRSTHQQPEVTHYGQDSSAFQPAHRARTPRLGTVQARPTQDRSGRF